ncbi:MAG: 16S rRNA (guanine(527)-N(7))-methyltransferase RsmG [Saprospiraceae bacterium]
MEKILQYINPLNPIQIDRFSELKNLYDFWNVQINVISRKDMDQFYLHHVLHSLCITKFINFNSGTKIMDLGCGGGFPGIPLAIFFPEVEFVLIDSIGKKIKVVNEVSKALQLQNIRAYHTRVEDHKEKFQFVISRAVAKCIDLLTWTKNSYDHLEINSIPNGLLAYKGGNLAEELLEIKSSNPYEKWSISDKISEEYFQNKFIVYVQK